MSKWSGVLIVCTSRCQLNVHFKMYFETQRKTSNLQEKEKSNFYLRDDVVYRKRNTRRIDEDHHSPSFVITTEILVMDASDHTEGLKFFLLLLRHWLLLLLQYIHIALLQSFFTTHQHLIPLTDYAEKKGENKTTNTLIVIH